MSTFPELLYLKSEVKAILLGYYDFERFSIILNSHDDRAIIPITLQHEANHLRLNTGSTFGLLLNRVANQLKRTQDHLIRSKLEDLLQLLLSKCTIVHEMMATYTSLVANKREDLVSTMPAEYQQCFHLMSSMLRNVPSVTIWRTSMAWHLARTAMLVDPISHSNEDLDEGSILEIFAKVSDVELQSPNFRMKLLYDAMQRFDFDKFQVHLDHFGAPESFIMPFLDYEDPRQIVKAMERSIEDWGALQNEFDSSLMYALIEMFDDLLPGLEDARGHMSLIRLGRIANVLDRRSGMTSSKPRNSRYAVETREQLLDLCEQVITFFEPGSVSTIILSLAGAFVPYTALLTHHHLQTIFLLVLLHYRDQTLEDIEVHVTDFGDNRKIPHIIIQGNGAVGVMALVEPIITIIEINTLGSIWQKGFFDHLGSKLSYRKPFLHCDINPLLMIEGLLFSGCDIEWCVSRIAYREGPVGAKSDLQVCVYWIDKCSIPVFHLSNTPMTSAILKFSDEFIADDHRFRRVEYDTLVERISAEDFSRLFDHPVLVYYLCGTTAKKEVEKARKS